MIQTSEQINEIAAALAKAQATMENVGKTAEANVRTNTGPGFKYRYSTLGDVLDEVRPKLAEQGIAIIQAPVNGEGANIGVVTRLAHTSGQWIESVIYVASGKFDAQGVGSATTYLRRYSLMALAGIGPEDDDGSAAVAQPVGSSRPRDAAPPVRPGTAERERQWAGGSVSREAATEIVMSQAHANGINEELDAKASGRRVFAALSRAGTVKLIDEIIDLNSDDLAKLKGVDEAAYDAVMMKATARKNELLSGV